MAAEVVILGGGVGGTLTANLVARHAGRNAHVTVVDSTGRHVYQPGFLYVAVGQEKPENLSREETTLLRDDVDLVADAAVAVDPAARTVRLASGRTLRYDYLALATGSRTVMDEVPGAEGAYDFYSMDGATGSTGRWSSSLAARSLSASPASHTSVPRRRSSSPSSSTTICGLEAFESSARSSCSRPSTGPSRSRLHPRWCSRF